MVAEKVNPATPEIYKSFFTVFYPDGRRVMYDLPLPPGDWQWVGQENTNAQQTFFLVQVQRARVQAYLRLRVGTGAIDTALNADENVHFVELASVVPHVRRGPEVMLPPYAMVTSRTMGRGSERIVAWEYGVFVNNFGFAAPTDLAQFRQQWGAAALAADPAKQKFVAAFSEYARQYAPWMTLAYRRERFRNQLGAFMGPATAPGPTLSTPLRRALVIGNNRYQNVPVLSTAVEDAKSVAAAWTQYGYNVTLRLDVNEKEMKTAWREFKAQVRSGDEVAVFYAGHGVQMSSSNYLLPIDVQPGQAEQLRDEALALQRILDDMAEHKARLTLAVIDACRDNPFSTTLTRALERSTQSAPTSLATGQMVVFSAGAGQQALDRLSPDDSNKNSLFTRVFLAEMRKPGVSIDRLVRQVRTEVFNLAKSVGHEQVPAIYDQVVGEFFFLK